MRWLFEYMYDTSHVTYVREQRIAAYHATTHSSMRVSGTLRTMAILSLTTMLKPYSRTDFSPAARSLPERCTG